MARQTNRFSGSTALAVALAAGPSVGLGLGLVACDSDGEAPAVTEWREGKVASFKTTSHDTSFKWKGCFPDDDDWWWRGATPGDRWMARFVGRVDREQQASVLDAWLAGAGRGGESCEAACAELDAPWRAGSVWATDVVTRVGMPEVYGWCEYGRTPAWSVDVEATATIHCECR